MKVIKILVLSMGLLTSALVRAGVSPGSDSLGGVEDLLRQERQHARSTAPRMSLTELEREALVSNPEIRLLSRRIAIAEARARIVGSREDPSFMYRGWGTPLQRPWDLNLTQHMFMYSQSLPGPGKRALRAEVAGKETEIAKAQLEAKKREVTAQVRRAFYDLLRSQDELVLHDDQAALARQAVEEARIKYVVGKVPQQDVLKAQIALTKLVEHLVMLQQEGGLATSRLNFLLGRDPASPIAVEGQYAPPDTLPPLLELERLALNNRPELAAASSAIHQGEARAKLAQKGYSPDYNLSAGYMLMPDGARYRNSYMAELSVTLPWLNRKRHDAEIAEAQAQVTAEQAEYDYQRSVVFQEIQEALVRAQSAKRLVNLYRNTLRPQAQASLKAAVSAYQADRTDFLNLLESQNTTLDVELAYYRSASELEASLADLERATGAPFERQASPPGPEPHSDDSDLSLEVPR
ncbi:MAG TPA: TolC family protein [Terriglobales bacterium]|nr:TolC family protein [Terriglobales bacterium]